MNKFIQITNGSYINISDIRRIWMKWDDDNNTWDIVFEVQSPGQEVFVYIYSYCVDKPSAERELNKLITDLNKNEIKE